MRGFSIVEAGWKAAKKEDLDKAQSLFAKASQENQSSAGIHIQQGLFLLEQNQFKKAVTSFRSAAAADATNPAPLFFLCLALELDNESKLAAQTLTELTAVCPRHQGLASLNLLLSLRQGDPTKSLQSMGFSSKTTDDKNTWKTLAAGIGMGDPAWLASDLSSSPYLLGPILIEIEKSLLPLEYPKLEHRASKLLTDLSLLKAKKQNLREELRSLPSSWKAGSKLRKGKSILNKSYEVTEPVEQHRKLDLAIELLESGLKLDPHAFRTNFHLGEAYLWNSKSEPGTPYRRDMLLKAEAHLIESVRIDGANPYVYLLLGLTSQLLGRPLTALELYAKATEKFTKMPEAHYGMGQCYLLLGQQVQAKKYLLMAVNSDLQLAKERIELYTSLLELNGKDFFSHPLPCLPPEVPPAPELESTTPGIDKTDVHQEPQEAISLDSHTQDMRTKANPTAIELGEHYPKEQLQGSANKISLQEPENASDPESKS